MALLWMDGFDTYGVHNDMASAGGTADAMMSSSGYGGVNNTTMNQNTRTGRGLCVNLRRGAAGSQYGQFKRAVSTQSELIVGVAIKTDVSDFDRFLLLQYDDLMGSVWTHIAIARNAQNGVSVVGYTGSGSILFTASEPNVLFPNVWHYVEVKFNPAGHVIVRVDGAVVISAGGYCSPAAPALVNLVCCRAGPEDFVSNNWSYFDDLYICNTQGAIFNDFCGDVVIHAVLPLGDATPNQMTPFGGGLSNYTAVDDLPPDDDLSYLYSNTLGHIDMFSTDPLPANIIDVLAVSVHARVKKDAAGTSNIKLKCSYNAATVDSPAKPLTTVYQNKHHIYETAPDGGAWSKLKADNMQIGVEIA